VIAKYLSISIPSSNHISWRHLKNIIADNTCLRKIINIANTCIFLEHWPKHFKEAISVVISKPNKDVYNTTKVFWLIVLLNTTGKLIEKVISNWLQFYMSANGFLDSNQLEGIRQCSTINAGLYLTYIICTG